MTYPLNTTTHDASLRILLIVLIATCCNQRPRRFFVIGATDLITVRQGRAPKSIPPAAGTMPIPQAIEGGLAGLGKPMTKSSIILVTTLLIVAEVFVQAEAEHIKRISGR